MEKKEDSAEGINAKFDWDSSFFRQCERIDTSTTPGDFKKNLDILWAKLSPYEDDKYEEDKDKAFDEIKKELELYERTGIFSKELNGIVWNNLLSRYVALMKLAFRQKVLPQRNIPQKKIGVKKKGEGKEKKIGVSGSDSK